MLRRCAGTKRPSPDHTQGVPADDALGGRFGAPPGKFYDNRKRDDGAKRPQGCDADAMVAYMGGLGYKDDDGHDIADKLVYAYPSGSVGAAPASAPAAPSARAA